MVLNSVVRDCLFVLKCQYVGTVRCFVDQSYSIQMSKKSQLLILPYRLCWQTHGHVNSKGNKLGDLLMYKEKIVNKIEMMGWKESRNPKLWISVFIR